MKEDVTDEELNKSRITLIKIFVGITQGKNEEKQKWSET